MAAFTAKDVQALREKTGVGMMKCKEALVASDGDMEKAIDFLREKGLAASQKKASRVAAEGVVLAYVDEEKKIGVVLEVNSETDFVAKNEKFTDFVSNIAKTIVRDNPADIEALNAAKLEGSDVTVEEMRQELVLSIGENMKIRRFERVEGHAVTYIHGGGTVAVLVLFDTDDATAAKDEFKVMGKNVAMQIAAMSPEYLSVDDISKEELEKMKNITIESALNKPDSLPKPILLKVVEKVLADKLWSDEDVAAYEEQKNNKFLFNFLSQEAIQTLANVAVAGKEEYAANPIFGKAVEGRIKKQIKEICLLEQPFVRTDLFEGSVGGYIADVAKKLGADIKPVKFIRFGKGEGLQKREDNFAEEVASMM